MLYVYLAFGEEYIKYFIPVGYIMCEAYIIRDRRERISLKKDLPQQVLFLVRVTGLATARMSRLHAHGLANRPPEGWHFACGKTALFKSRPSYRQKIPGSRKRGNPKFWCE